MPGIGRRCEKGNPVNRALHGCADKKVEKCILTDEDFGRAYLSQGWATRFLISMFSRYVVLFVGYSHNDTVMNYLARGLPPGNQQARFAFSTDDDQSLSKWKHLEIQPLVYKPVEAKNLHGFHSDDTGLFSAVTQNIHRIGLVSGPVITPLLNRTNKTL